MKKLFFRCNSGHFFSALHCPWDGWSTPEVVKAHDIGRRLAGNASLEMAELLNSGVSEAILEESMIIEFLNEDCAFTGIGNGTIRK